jgi:hypothetical protein
MKQWKSFCPEKYQKPTEPTYNEPSNMGLDLTRTIVIMVEEGLRVVKTLLLLLEKKRVRRIA